MQASTQTSRNYELAAQVSTLGDDALIGSEELAAFLGIERVSIQTHCVQNLPKRVVGVGRRMQWRMGDVRAFVRAKAGLPQSECKPQEIDERGKSATTQKKKIETRGRPAKAQHILKRGSK